MSEWQPIETAPRDGTRIILFRPNWVESMAIGFYYASYEQWTVIYAGVEFCDVTHWMPLPESPK